MSDKKERYLSGISPNNDPTYTGEHLTEPTEHKDLFESEEERLWMKENEPELYEHHIATFHLTKKDFEDYKKLHEEGKIVLKEKTPEEIEKENKERLRKERQARNQKKIDAKFEKDFAHLTHEQKALVRMYLNKQINGNAIKEFEHLLPPNFIEKYKEKYKPQFLKKENPKRRLPDAFATIDIEVQSWVNYVCGGIFTMTEKGEHYEETGDLTKLMILCFDFSRKYGCLSFLAHYGGKFDFLHFLSVIATHELFHIVKLIPRSSSILAIEVQLNPLVCEKYGVIYHDATITFRDSFALLPFSLGMLTKTFQVEAAKGEVDFDFIDAVYEGRPYERIIATTPDRYTMFYHGFQISMGEALKLSTHELKNIRYWNHTRHVMMKLEEPKWPIKIKKGKKPSQKKDNRLSFKKIDQETWIDAVSYPIFKKEHLLDYLYRDCKGLYQVIEKFFDTGYVKFANKAWTTASQAVNVYRLFMKKDIASLPDSDIYKEGNVDGFVRKAYFGGRTEVFKPVFDHELHDAPYLDYSDVNSLYPYVMSKNKFPNRFIGWRRGFDEYEKSDLGVWHCLVDVPETLYAPPLPVKHDNKLIFPVGRFSGYWTKYELEYAKSLGVKILEIHEGAIFEDYGNIFEHYINTLYQARLIAKDQGDDVTQLVIKLIMNSTYGKMGMNKERTNMCFDEGQMNFRLLHEVTLNGKYIRIGETEADMSKAFSNVAIACYVTSYARVHLHKQFMKVGVKHLYYCDTDSLFADKVGTYGKELGELKLEYRIKSACFLAPKTYVSEGIIYDDGTESKESKVVMKGFDYKKIRHMFSVSDFMNYLQGDNTKIFVEEEPKFASLKTALRLGGFVTMKNDPTVERARDERKELEYEQKTGRKKAFIKKEYKKSIRQLKSTYDKRVIIDFGLDTRPLIMGKDIQEEIEKPPVPFQLQGHFF